MRNKKKILDTQSPMKKLTAEPSVKSNTEVEIEENTKLTVKTSTASKDDKTEADQKSPSTAEPPSLRTKAVDKILTGWKNPDLTPENFPVLNKTEDNQIEEAHDTGENGRKNSKNMPNSIVEPRSHRGHTLKEEDDKPKNSNLPGSIPLQEMVTSKSEEKELVRNVKSLSISEKTQQDPPKVSQEAKLTPKENPSCLRQKEVTSSRE